MNPFAWLKALFTLRSQLAELQLATNVLNDSVGFVSDRFDEAQDRYVTFDNLRENTEGPREVVALYRELVDVLGKHGIELDVRQLRHSLRRLP